MNTKTLKILAILLTNTLFSQNVSTSQAINIIGKQCMLTQRIAAKKVYLSGTQKTNQIKKETTSFIIQFEQNISMLNSMSVSPDLREKIKTTEMLWFAYKENILNTSSQANTKILDYSNIILDASKKVQKQLHKISEMKNEYPYDSNNTEFVDAYKSTNNVKYLSQKLSFLYELYYYKYSNYNDEKFNNTIKKIDHHIDVILKMKGKKNLVTEKIDSLEYEWKNLKAILYKVIKEKFISIHTSPKPETIIKTCNVFLKNADLLIREYKSLSETSK